MTLIFNVASCSLLLQTVPVASTRVHQLAYYPIVSAICAIWALCVEIKGLVPASRPCYTRDISPYHAGPRLCVPSLL